MDYRKIKMNYLLKVETPLSDTEVRLNLAEHFKGSKAIALDGIQTGTQMYRLKTDGLHTRRIKLTLLITVMEKDGAADSYYVNHARRISDTILKNLDIMKIKVTGVKYRSSFLIEKERRNGSENKTGKTDKT